MLMDKSGQPVDSKMTTRNTIDYKYDPTQLYYTANILNPILALSISPN